MDLKAEKKLLIALSAAALAVLLLLPFLFRELEPDYDVAYSMDSAKKGRFASRDESVPSLSNVYAVLSSSSAAAAVPATKAVPDSSAHRALPSIGGASAAAPVAAKPSSASGADGSRADRRLIPLAGGGLSGSGGASQVGGGAKLEDARTAQPAAADERRLGLELVAGDAAKLAQGLGLGDVAGMALTGGAKLDAAGECTQTSARLKPRILSASQASKRAAENFRDSGCPLGSCGRHAADCVEIQRTPDEERAARRRCSCDRLECRKIETCRAVDDLRCEEARACLGRAASCASSCS